MQIGSNSYVQQHGLSEISHNKIYAFSLINIFNNLNLKELGKKIVSTFMSPPLPLQTLTCHLIEG
jgi:hypothetical protein